MKGAKSLSFAGRVAVVTGGARGLGREYSLLLAKLGASVLVNDLGIGIGSKWKESSKSAADETVEEIRAKGGKATANYNSVEDGDKIIESAIDAFGRVDIVINNAGFLRDRSFLKMTDDDWDAIFKVHVLGAFRVSRAAWPHMRNQQYGRIIMTSSGAGMFGNFGQANYSCAKMGLIGLSKTLAIEGAKYGIHCNVVVPVAASRLTEGILPPDIFDKLQPKFVAPVVCWLCHENCEESGSIVETAGGWVAKYGWERSRGVAFPPNDQMTVDAVRKHWEEICDMKETFRPTSLESVIVDINDKLSNPINLNNTTGNSDNINLEVALKTKFNPIDFHYTTKDVILYALGVGCSIPRDLKYLYEGHSDFCALPSFAIIPAQSSLMESGFFTGSCPGLNIDLTKVLHGEQYLELFKPIPQSGILKSTMKVADVLDKGSSAVVLLDIDTWDEHDTLISRNQFTIFVVGAGGFGGQRTSNKAVPLIEGPKRTPDVVATTKTEMNQPALYRLNGDFNPLHIDRDFAAMAGFSAPILHGLCTLGVVSRQVLEKFADDDPNQFKAIKIRFAKPVNPGDAIETKMWKEQKRVFVESSSSETKQVVLRGYVDLVSDAAQSPSQTVPPPPSPLPSLKSDAAFEELGSRVASSPDQMQTIKGIIEFAILKNGSLTKTWTLDFQNSPFGVYPEPPKTKSDLILTVEDDVIVEIMSGKLKPQQAFMKKQIVFKGKMTLLQKLDKLFRSAAKL